mgnify:CR=1 FL=1
MVSVQFKICNKLKIYANIKYEEKQTKLIPNVKFNFLLGLNSCHKNGMPKSKMGYAAIPSSLFNVVNQ